MGSVTSGGRRILAWSGWDHCDLGDVGHTPGLLRTLEEFVPEAPVTLMANQLDERTGRMLATRFPSVEMHEGGLWEDGDTGRHLRGLPDGGDAGLFVRASNMGSETLYMDGLITAWVCRTGLRVRIAPEARKEIARNRRLNVNRLASDVRPAWRRWRRSGA